MSNLGPLRGNQLRVPTPPRGDTIARYATYLEAQRAVDYLSDQAFPVQFVTIVGTGLRMVERVTGRLTYPKVAGASALSGAWFGLFVGLVLTLFGGGNGAVLPAAVLFGAGFGILFGIISYSLTGGRRDFTSSSQIVASEYEVLCLPEQAGRARELLGQLQAQGEVHSLGGPPGPGGSNPYAAPMPPPYGSPPSPYGSPPSPYGPPPGGQAPGYPPQPPPYQRPGAPGPAPAAEPEPPVTGPTYGEMIERQRREREAAERQRVEREAAQQRAAQQRAAAEPSVTEPPATEPPAAEPPAADASPTEPSSSGRPGIDQAAPDAPPAQPSGDPEESRREA
ncbi:MAG: general stress protein [Kineosporiaceae bacterium]